MLDLQDLMIHSTKDMNQLHRALQLQIRHMSFLLMTNSWMRDASAAPGLSGKMPQMTPFLFCFFVWCFLLVKRHPGDKRKLGVEDVLRSLGVQFEAGGLNHCQSQSQILI